MFKARREVPLRLRGTSRQLSINLYYRAPSYACCSLKFTKKPPERPKKGRRAGGREKEQGESRAANGACADYLASY